MDDNRATSEKTGPWSERSSAPPTREPLSKAPWPPLVIALVLIGIYAVQALGGDAALCSAGDPLASCSKLAFAPAQLDAGDFTGLLTALFMHGSWAHVVFNSIFAVAFGAPVASLFGLNVRGVLTFFLFFLVCGVSGNLGYALIHPHSAVPVIGASGAVAGFMGGASRLLERRLPDGRVAGLAPYLSRTVVAMAAAWIAINLIVGVLGVDVGFATAGQPVAWEAHLFGYAAGLFLLGSAARLTGALPPKSGRADR